MTEYLVTGQAYKVDDQEKQTQLLFLTVPADNKTDASQKFHTEIKNDGYYLVKLISVVEKT